MNLKSTSDEELMGLFKSGNSDAFLELYDRYSKRLLHFFFKMFGGNEDKAQDFVQETFLKILKKPALYSDQYKFSSWIYTIASNLCKNEYRRISVRSMVKNEENIDDLKQELFDSGNKIEDGLDKKEFMKKLLNELKKFDYSKRFVFILRFQNNLAIREIAEIMDCSEGTVKSRLFYITKKLSVKMKEFKVSSKGAY